MLLLLVRHWQLPVAAVVAVLLLLLSAPQAAPTADADAHINMHAAAFTIGGTVSIEATLGGVVGVKTHPGYPGKHPQLTANCN